MMHVGGTGRERSCEADTGRCSPALEHASAAAVLHDDGALWHSARLHHRLRLLLGPGLFAAPGFGGRTSLALRRHLDSRSRRGARSAHSLTPRSEAIIV